MRLTAIFLPLLAGSALAAEVTIPQPLPAARYERMVEKSPFALATPPAVVAVPQASFAANWFVSGIARLGEQDFVAIKSRDQSTAFTLHGRDPNLENNVALASIDWNEAIGKSTVIVKRGTETAKLEFNEAEVRGPVQVTPLPGAKPPIPLPTGSAPTQPRVAIPRPSGAPVMAPPVPQPNAATGSESRRRVRVINAPQ